MSGKINRALMQRMLNLKNSADPVDSVLYIYFMSEDDTWEQELENLRFLLDMLAKFDMVPPMTPKMRDRMSGPIKQSLAAVIKDTTNQDLRRELDKFLNQIMSSKKRLVEFGFAESILREVMLADQFNK